MQKQIKALVEKELSCSVTSIEFYPKGLTNKNWLVKSDQGDVMVRWPHHDSKNIVHRDHEAKAMALIKDADLDLETLYFNPQTGVKITRFLSDLQTFSEYQGSDKIERTAHLMRKLHGLNVRSGVLFDPLSRYNQYANLVKNPLVTSDVAQRVMDQFKSFTPRLTLCHNDWVAGNICFTPTHDYLIDYEYAGDNDPYFDVMSFITENDLSEDEKERFMQSYFQGSWSEEDKKRLYAYGDFHNLLWLSWASMMYESRHDAIYLSIAQMKKEALLKCLAEVR